MLFDVALFLAAAVLFVPLFRRLGLGAVLGYLSAGIAIGPWGFGLIDDVDVVLHVSELGVVMLLFIIGLELQPSRLWALRRAVFGLGGAQVLVTTLVLALTCLLLGLSPVVSAVVGFSLAMSSTAFVIQLLAEKKELGTRHGRAAFAILLFQDLSIIPFLALVPLLAPGALQPDGAGGWIDTARVVGMLLGLVLIGRYALRPLLRAVAATQLPELFTAAALLVVIGTALSMTLVGLSMSLGAFLAGVMLADSEFRHELQADIEPFKGLLLGLFFIAVGMSTNLELLADKPTVVIGLVVALLLIKGVLLFALGRAAGLPPYSARALSVTLGQGGEFGFVLLGVAAGAQILPLEMASLIIVVITLTMIATPALVALHARFDHDDHHQRPFDDIEPTPDHQVLIAGFGPFGQIVGRVLRVKRIPFTVLDKDSSHVDFVSQFGNKVFYGDAGRLDLLRAAHAHKARLFVLTIPDIEASLHVAEIVRRNFPKLRIFAVAVNRQHALRLMDLGITDIVRRSYYSSLEMARGLLVTLGDSEDSARRVIDTFRQHDEQTLHRQRAIYRDPQALAQTSREAARELEQLFDSDTRT